MTSRLCYNGTARPAWKTHRTVLGNVFFGATQDHLIIVLMLSIRIRWNMIRRMKPSVQGLLIAYMEGIQALFNEI